MKVRGSGAYLRPNILQKDEESGAARSYNYPVIATVVKGGV